MYEALYRKYRPATFAEVVGQEHITETLRKQVMTGRLSHAYLFIGSRGTGKTTCARILAKAVNCLHPVNGDPCCECAVCRGIDDGSVMDIVEIDAASNNGVDDIRMLRDEAVFSPTTAKKRVYIIDEVHMLSKPAFNALLKILEEPPEHLMFILATTEMQKVLPTILSRCQRHSFRRIRPEVIAGRLSEVARREGLNLTPGAAALLGRLAEGGMRDGLSLLDQCASLETIDEEAVRGVIGLTGSLRIAELAGDAAKGDIESALRLYEELWQEGREPSSILSELAGLMRDAMLLRLAPKEGQNFVSGAYGGELLSSVPLDGAALLRALNTIEKYQAEMRNAVTPRLQAELCLTELCGIGAGVPAAEYAAPAPVPVRPATEVRNTPRPAAPTPAVQPAAVRMPVPEPAAAAEAPHTASPVPESTGVPDPAPVEKAEPAAPPIKPAPTSGGDWNTIVAALRSELRPGEMSTIGNPSMVCGTVGEKELVIYAQPFAMGRINRPEIINRIRITASKVLGREVTVRLTDYSAAPSAAEDKLDALSRFGDMVTFK